MIIDRLIDYIEDNVTLNAPLRSGVLSEEESAVSIRPTPSSIATRYSIGKVFEFAFQITVKDTDDRVARGVINRITEAMDGLGNEAITFDHQKLIRCEVSTSPNFIEKTERGEYIYTAIFVAELEGGYS